MVLQAVQMCDCGKKKIRTVGKYKHTQYKTPAHTGGAKAKAVRCELLNLIHSLWSLFSLLSMIGFENQ